MICNAAQLPEHFNLVRLFYAAGINKQIRNIYKFRFRELFSQTLIVRNWKVIQLYANLFVRQIAGLHKLNQLIHGAFHSCFIRHNRSVGNLIPGF